MKDQSGIHFYATDKEQPLYLLSLLDDEYAFVDAYQLDQIFAGHAPWIDTSRIISVSVM